MAAVGSAIGLGNIWRFSYMCYRNGGGTFLVPYLIALLTTGIPLMILEFAIGHKMQTSAPHSMHRIHPRWEWLGWWPVLFVMFGIDLYYVVIIAWCGLYMLAAFRGMWGAGSAAAFPWQTDPDGYFHQVFLRLSDNVFAIGGVSWPILGMTIVVWFILWLICTHNVDRGIELASRIFMPALFVLTLILVVWGLTLDGAGEGIRQYLKPDVSKLGDVQVWRDAYSQIFFSLSIGFGIMIAYASYLPRQTDLVRSAFVTSFCDCGYSILAGFAVFSILGFMAAQTGARVQDVATEGPGLCFVVYPQAIAALPHFRGLFGSLFFLTLMVAGITSAMSIVEAFASAMVDKFGWNRFRVVTISCIIGVFGSIIFTTRAGLLWLDIVDHFLNSYGLVVVGLFECLLVGWYYRIDKLHFHLSSARQGAYPKLWDIWWEWSVTFVAPMVLLIILVWSALDDLRRPYGGYPKEALLSIGMGVILVTFLASGFFSTLTRHKGREPGWDDEDLRD